MKRAGYLYERFLCLDTFKKAWVQARRGKSRKDEVIEFSSDPETRLLGLMESVRQGSFRFGQGTVFTIHDPKERIIHAPCFAERIIHHALMLVLDPVFDSCQINDSYASRRGRGTQSALMRAFRGVKASRFFLKLDVRKYFDSIDHRILKILLRRKFKDPEILAVLDGIIDSYETATGKGLPIGNLTSQYFANHYLSGLDHSVMDAPRPHGPGVGGFPSCPVSGPVRWLRYMDDMVLFSNDRTDLTLAEVWIRRYCREERALELKPAVTDSCERGLPFLGFLLKPSGIFLTRKTRDRFAAGSRILERDFLDGRIGELQFGLRSQAMVAHVELARSRRFRHSVFHGRVLGVEPREPRRQLEQRCRQLSGFVSEQQQSRQPEQ